MEEEFVLCNKVVCKLSSNVLPNPPKRTHEVKVVLFQVFCFDLVLLLRLVNSCIMNFIFFRKTTVYVCFFTLAN